MTVDDFVDLHRDRYSVGLLCAAVGLPRSTYYARRQLPGGSRSRLDAELARQIEAVRQGHNRSRGRRTVREALRRQGVRVGERRVGRVMRAEGWYGTPRSSRPRTQLPVPVKSYSDLVHRQFHAEAPNRLWWADVKTISSSQGPVYLATLQDAFSRCIVGFAFSPRNDTQLTVAALSRAVQQRRPGRGLVHHSDRGSPYLAWTYQSQLERLGGRQSVSRVGNPYDNACIESWHSTLQRELLAFHRFETAADVVTTVSAWIRHFNQRRFHSTLGLLTPLEYETLRA